MSCSKKYLVGVYNPLDKTAVVYKLRRLNTSKQINHLLCPINFLSSTNIFIPILILFHKKKFIGKKLTIKNKSEVRSETKFGDLKFGFCLSALSNRQSQIKKSSSAYFLHRSFAIAGNNQIIARVHAKTTYVLKQYL